MTNKHYFFLGSVRDLSLNEIKSLTNIEPKHINDEIISIGIDSQSIPTISKRLGGTTKIAVAVKTTISEDILRDIQEIITPSPNKNVAISNYTEQRITESEISNIKSNIQKHRSIRFLSFQDSSHSLVALRKQNTLNINIIPDGKDIVIAKTIWIQNSDEWRIRDRKKPYQDINRGMLPPKIARIMVNLATGDNDSFTIVDPFCGTGTISMEALLLNNTVYASDIDKHAVTGTDINLRWLKERYKISTTYHTQQMDAVHIHKHISDIDFIVTEPFMGPLITAKNQEFYIKSKKLTAKQLKNNIKGLDKLYKGALKSWYKVLKPEGKIVIVIPEFHLFSHTFTIPIIDTCEKLGYNKTVQIRYSKPNATVVRNILVLEKI